MDLRRARLGDHRKDNCGSEPARDSGAMFTPSRLTSPSKINPYLTSLLFIPLNVGGSRSFSVMVSV